MYRLTKASPKSRTTAQLPEDITNHHTEAYTYDAVGNRKTGPQPTDSYTYNAGNEQLTYTSKRLLSSINELKEYDSNGNLIKTTQTEGKLQTMTYYAYDDENRLIRVTLQKGNKTKEIRFAYWRNSGDITLNYLDWLHKMS